VAVEVVEQNDGQQTQTIVAGQQVTVGSQNDAGDNWLTLENLEKGVKLAVAGMTLIAGAVQVANLVSGKGGPLSGPPSKQRE